MNDTRPEVAEKMMLLYSQKAPVERLVMGCSMFDFSRQLVISSLRQGDVPLSSADLRRQLFLRFYGTDFDARTRSEILARM